MEHFGKISGVSDFLTLHKYRYFKIVWVQEYCFMTLPWKHVHRYLKQTNKKTGGKKKMKKRITIQRLYSGQPFHNMSDVRADVRLKEAPIWAQSQSGLLGMKLLRAPPPAFQRSHSLTVDSLQVAFSHTGVQPPTTWTCWPFLRTDGGLGTCPWWRPTLKGPCLPGWTHPDFTATLRYGRSGGRSYFWNKVTLAFGSGSCRLCQRSSTAIPQWRHRPGGRDRCDGFHPR